MDTVRMIRSTSTLLGGWRILIVHAGYVVATHALEEVLVEYTCVERVHWSAYGKTNYF